MVYFLIKLLFLSSIKNGLFNNKLLINKVKNYDNYYYSILTFQFNEMWDFKKITNITSNVLENVYFQQ